MPRIRHMRENQIKFACYGQQDQAYSWTVMRIRRIANLSLVLLGLSPSAWARYPAAMEKVYTGRHQEVFATQYDRVRLLVNQAQLEVSSRLGLIQYREGFVYPLVIRFDDGAPSGIESAVAYVRLLKSNSGFMQELVVNLDA